MELKNIVLYLLCLPCFILALVTGAGLVRTTELPPVSAGRMEMLPCLLSYVRVEGGGETFSLFGCVALLKSTTGTTAKFRNP